MINILLKVSELNEMIMKSLERSAILSSVPFLLLKDALPSLIAFCRIFSHGGGLSVVQLVSDLGEELMDWLPKDYVDALPHSLFTVPNTFSMLELAISLWKKSL